LAGTAQVATPLPFTATFEHKVAAVVLSTKVTVPVLTVLVLVVVDVKVTAWLVFDGLIEEAKVVVVAAAAVVVMSSDHPPEIVTLLPAEPVSSAR
jgi:hypothetical protein